MTKVTVYGNPYIGYYRLVSMTEWLEELGGTDMYKSEWGGTVNKNETLYAYFKREDDATAFKLKFC